MDKLNVNNELVSLLKILIDMRKDVINLSGQVKLAKLSDCLDEADFDIAKAIRNLKQALKQAGKLK